eukprot:1158279-Pelagomonas_calceolata.AAC.3
MALEQGHFYTCPLLPPPSLSAHPGKRACADLTSAACVCCCFAHVLSNETPTHIPATGYAANAAPLCGTGQAALAEDAATTHSAAIWALLLQSLLHNTSQQAIGYELSESSPEH